MDPLYYLSFMFVFDMPSCLFLAALSSPAGKSRSLGSLLSYVFLRFVSFPYGVPGQVWFLVVSNPDLCQMVDTWIKPGVLFYSYEN